MGATRFLTRLSLEERIARALGYIITVRRCPADLYRKTAATLGEARCVAARMDAVGIEGEPPATIAAITPEGTRFRVPDSCP